MDQLAVANTLVVSQKKEWGEIATGFEARNRYVVLNELGNELYQAQEQAGSLLARWFLKAFRPFTIVLSSPDGIPALHVERPFRFYFHKLDVRAAAGKLLGTVEREFSWIHRLFLVSDAQGHELCRLQGPLFHPWTFLIRQNDREVGKITKKWSGLLKEGFTDTDNFAAVLPPGMNTEAKSVLLDAVFLIDFVHFENR
ncbi:MAG: phospholipid scramblase-related protein [Terriglobia bacterium]